MREASCPPFHAERISIRPQQQERSFGTGQRFVGMQEGRGRKESSGNRMRQRPPTAAQRRFELVCVPSQPPPKAVTPVWLLSRRSKDAAGFAENGLGDVAR